MATTRSQAKTITELKTAIKAANTAFKKCKDKDKAWFVCDSCNKLKMGGAHYLDTSKWGYERPFCDSCTSYCKSCGEWYSNDMDYRHEDCGGEGDEGDEGDEDK